MKNTFSDLGVLRAFLNSNSYREAALWMRHFMGTCRMCPECNFVKGTLYQSRTRLYSCWQSLTRVTVVQRIPNKSSRSTRKGAQVWVSAPLGAGRRCWLRQRWQSSTNAPGKEMRLSGKQRLDGLTHTVSVRQISGVCCRPRPGHGARGAGSQAGTARAAARRDPRRPKACAGAGSGPHARHLGVRSRPPAGVGR